MLRRPGFWRQQLSACAPALALACLAATPALAQDQTRPAARQPAGPPPDAVRARLAKVPLPALKSAADVPAFVDAASAAPVARREEIRAIVQRAQKNPDVAKGLIAAFETAQRTDFSRALVTLALIGEQRHPTGTEFLTKFVRQAPPRGSKPTNESGISPEAETLDRLQVKAANALPYARTAPALQATLDIVRSHPSKAVRVEAASSYLWNTGNTEAARSTLTKYLRKDELMVLDRPVRTEGMTGEQFNRQLAVYLDRHPEVRAPAPKLGRAPRRSVEETSPAPPSESKG
jgi:hypothetical protein